MSLGLYFIAGLIILYKMGVFKGKTNNREVQDGGLDQSLRVGNELWYTTVGLIVWVSVGAFVVQLLEGISSTEMLQLFLGYRDISFNTDRGKLFASIWIFIGVSVFAKAVRHLMEYACIKMGKCFRH
ncbi:hypothetical protein ABKV19_021044 [Rosa sericea]